MVSTTHSHSAENTAETILKSPRSPAARSSVKNIISLGQRPVEGEYALRDARRVHHDASEVVRAVAQTLEAGGKPFIADSRE